MTSLFINPEIVRAEVEARRERLIRDWPRRSPRHRPTQRRQLAVHLPVRARRHA